MPYGLTVLPDSTGGYQLYVTDNYEQAKDVIPPDSLLGERVRQYRFSIQNDTLQATLVRSIGDTAGKGVLHVVESILADPAYNRLLIAEEDEPGSHVKVYTLDGSYTGQQFNTTYFPHQAEGLALYTCDGKAGYWIATDQGTDTNTFHLFDRVTLDHVGAFTGAQTRNTDGIALTQQGFGPFPQGAFYAVHDDGNVAAFAWDRIASALGLDC